jgi:hypothetical protein
MRKATLLLVLAAVAACTHDDVGAISQTAPAGPCSIGAAARESITGLATYSVLRARVPNVSQTAPGTRGLTLTCLTPGTGGTLLTLMLPGLSAGKPASPGTYHLERPGDRPFDERSAWGEALLTVSAPARYLAVGGTIQLQGELDGILIGSYQVALLRGPDVAPRYPEQQVLWGAFRAPLAHDSAATRR